MNKGILISGIGHAGLILWVLFGGWFWQRHDNPQIAVSQVSLVSPQEFAALDAAASAPPAAPQLDVKAPRSTAPDTSPLPKPEPKPDVAPAKAVPARPAPASAPEAKPIEPAQPLPQASASGTPPVLPAPPSDNQTAVLTPKVSVKPALRPAPRVAPMPAPKPEQGAKVAPETRQSVVPVPSDTATKQQKAQQTQAPKEAATAIVTEADKKSSALTLAPVSSPRPRNRPQQVAKVVQAKPAPAKPADTGAADASSVDAAVDAALAALKDAPTAPSAPAPSGPPLTAGEKNGLRLSVQRCWVVDVGSDASNVTVTVGFSLNQDGTVVSGSVRQVSATGGTGDVVRAAFDAARRAVYRCGADGYKLPPDKFDQWRNVEIVFNPEKMRMK